MAPRFRTEIDRFFAAMQGGASHEAEMMSLFADDAVYVEPFSGALRTHRGKAAIRAAMRASLSAPLPDVRIVVDRVDVAGDVARAAWTCFSPALPGGSGSGVNEFHFRGGLVVRLETSLDGGRR
jgi:ketosteroid isomerase-like protein